MIKDLDKQQALLADYMSELSEEAYAAGWMDGLEYALWKAILNGETSYGRLSITNNEIKKLKELSNSCKCWVYFDGTNEETFIDLKSWGSMYENNNSLYESKIS